MNETNPNPVLLNEVEKRINKSVATVEARTGLRIDAKVRNAMMIAFLDGMDYGIERAQNISAKSNEIIHQVVTEIQQGLKDIPPILTTL